MLYLGLDVHSKWMTIKGFNPETGETVYEDKVPNDPVSLKQTFTKMDGPLHAAMESGTNAWAVYRTIEPYFEDLLVIDPATVWGREVKRGAKTNKRDAQKLALKLHRGELEPLYVPSVKRQDQRALTRAKINASRHVTKLVNEIGSLLKSWGIILECSLLSEKGKEIIDSSREKLPEYSLKALELYLELLKKAQEMEDELEKAVEKEAKEDRLCRILMSIPDVGPLTALTVVAEIGDIRRFGSVEQLISYCGLSPSVFASADYVHYGKLNRFCNRFLKYVIVLRAQGASRSKKDNPMRDTYWRVMLRKGKNNAKLTVARQMVRVMYRMLWNEEMWDPSKIAKRRGSQASKVA
jgi:transposase